MNAFRRLGLLSRRAARRLGLAGDAVRAEVERFLDRRAGELFAASGVPGLAAVVRLPTGEVCRRTFGEAGPGLGPMRTDTACPVLSMSKVATSFAVLTLVERRVLDLDAPVRLRSYPFPPEGTPGDVVDAITLRRLLSHGAGLAEFTPGRGERVRPRTAVEILREVEGGPRRLRLETTPGAGAGYSGGGFVVAQALVEEATGVALADYARDAVFRPLGLEGTDFDVARIPVARLAVEHDEENRPLPCRPALATASSGLFSTADDVATLFAALVPGPGGTPAGRGALEPSLCRLLHAANGFDADRAGWGLGLRVKERHGEHRYAHGGYDVGAHGYAEGAVRRRTAFSLLTNGRRGEDCVPRIAHELRRVLLDMPPLE
jgi:CubicO group peptidase (beta-lactamase class C family)